MPASTVTVRATGSSATTSSIDFKDRKSCVLSAMLLKQWRVPSTFSLLRFLTKFRTCWREAAGYRLSVPYSMLPAQFVSLLPEVQANRGEIMGFASNAAKRLIRVLLFMGMAKQYRHWPPNFLGFENDTDCTPVSIRPA